MSHALTNDRSSMHHGALANPFSNAPQPSSILPNPDLILPHSGQDLYDQIQEHEISSAFESKQEALVRTHALLTGYAYDNAARIKGIMTPELSPRNTRQSYDETALSDIYEEDDGVTPGTSETVSLMKHSLGTSEDCSYSGSYNFNDGETASNGEEDASRKSSRDVKNISRIDRNLASSRSASSTERSSTAHAPSTHQPTTPSDGEPSPSGAFASFILPTYLASQKSSVSTDESQSLSKRRSTRRPTTSLASALMRQSVVNSQPAHEDQTSSSSSSLPKIVPKNDSPNPHPRTASDGSLNPIRASHPGLRAAKQLRPGSTPFPPKRSTITSQVRRNSQPQPEVRGLQDQVTDLRIKVSTLKVRTQADNLRRRKSSQNMRGTLSSPSLFTDAKKNQWTGPDGSYRPLRATTGHDNIKDLRAMTKPKQQRQQQQLRELQERGRRSSNDYMNNNSLLLMKSRGDQRHTAHEYQPDSPRSRLLAIKGASDSNAKERGIHDGSDHGLGGGSGDSRQSSLRAANLLSKKFAAIVEDDSLKHRGRTLDGDADSNIRKTKSTHGMSDTRNSYDRSDPNRGIQRSVSAMPFEDTRNQIASRINESYWRMMNEQQQEQEAEVYGREDVSTPHEQRTDAFDYENFFLHSALGTYSNGTHDSSEDEEFYEEEEEYEEGEYQYEEDQYEEDAGWADEYEYGAEEEEEEEEEGEEEERDWENYYDEDLGQYEEESHYADAEEGLDGDGRSFAHNGHSRNLDDKNDDIRKTPDDSDDCDSDATARRSSFGPTQTPTVVLRRRNQSDDFGSSEEIEGNTSRPFQHTHSMPDLRSRRTIKSGTARGRCSPALTVTNSDPVDEQGSHSVVHSNNSSPISEGSTSYLTPRSSLSTRPDMVDSGIQTEKSAQSSHHHDRPSRSSPTPTAQSFRTYYSSLNNRYNNLDMPFDIDNVMDSLIESSATMYAPSSVTEAKDGKFDTILRDADRARLAALFTSIGQVAFRLQLSLATSKDDNYASTDNSSSKPSQAVWAASKLRERLDAAKKVLDGKVEIPAKSTFGTRLAKTEDHRCF